MLAMGCNLLNLIYYRIDDMFWSAGVEVIAVVLLIFFALCNNKGLFETTKFLSVILVNAHSLVLCYIQGLAGGAYLYLFPFVLAMIFLVRIRKNNRQLWLYGGITVANLLIIVLYIPQFEKTIEGAGPAAYYPHLVFNVILNFLLLITFFYFILRLLDIKEQRIKTEKKLADVILNTSLDAVLIVDRNTLQIMQYNDRMAELFSLPAFTTQQAPLAVLEVLGLKAEKQLRELQQTAQPDNWQDDIEFVTAAPRSFHGFTSIVPFAYQERSFFKISILDITSIKTAEFEIIKAREKAERASAAKTRFMSNMSHELRTPLNAIIGTMHLLLQEEPAASATEHFNILRHSSEHMLQLVNAVLDFNKLDAGMLELTRAPFNLASVLTETAGSFANEIKEKALILHLDIGSLPESLQVVGDALRFKQVFLNLLSNALKFTEQGMITVRARLEGQIDGQVQVYFAVSDTGIGIAPEKRHLIFDSFTQADAETTRKYGGSGLGLSISRELVKCMGSILQVTSEKGKGSCFYFTLMLPVLKETGVAAGDRFVPQALPQLSGVQVLLAEDSPFNARIAKRFLDSWGVYTDMADNGKIAFERFNEKSYDLLLIDLEMPEMDGKQFLREVRRINKHIPAIAFTASVYENMHEDLMQHGFDSFLHKPFRPEELHQKIAEFTTLRKHSD
jgi:signal transduction histidine kinase